MHLLIAREAVDQHLKVAGDLLEPGGEIKDRLASAGPGCSTPSGCRALVGKGQVPRSFDEFGSLAPYCASPSGPRAAGSLDLLRHGPLAGQVRVQQAFLGRLVDIGAELFAMAATAAYADTLDASVRAPTEAEELAELLCIQASGASRRCSAELWDNDDDANRRRCRACWTALPVARGGDRRPHRATAR